MKKLFALFLACIMLFLTSCNQTPPNETTNNSQNQEKPEDSVLKDTIIKDYHYDFIDTSSRILFVNPISPKYTCYYSKADGLCYISMYLNRYRVTPTHTQQEIKATFRGNQESTAGKTFIG